MLGIRNARQPASTNDVTTIEVTMHARRCLSGSAHYSMTYLKLQLTFTKTGGPQTDGASLPSIYSTIFSTTNWKDVNNIGLTNNRKTESQTK